MKKVLFASVAAIGLASAAHAAEPVKLGLGGFMDQWAGYANNGNTVAGSGASNLAKFDTQDDVRIKFLGSTKLDNGLTVAVEVDTMGTQGTNSHTSKGSNKDVFKSFMTVSGVFGTVEAGEQDNVGALIHNSAPDVAGIGGQDGYWSNWVIAPTNFNESYNRTYAGDDRSSNKLIYITPSFHGLAAGVSYTPAVNPAQAGHTSVPTQVTSNDSSSLNGYGDLWVYGLSYTNNFGAVSVKADVGSGVANLAGLNVYQGGLQVGYAGFTVGGSILSRQVDNSPARNLTDWRVAAKEGTLWDIGASYETGPYGVSLTYFHGTAANNDIGSGISSTNNGVKYDDTDYAVSLGGAYAMGPGVKLTGSVNYINYESGSSVNSVKDKNSNQGVAVITGVAVNF